MELLKTALLIILLTATSAVPRGFRRHHDADIPEQKMLGVYHRFIEGASFEDSSDSSQSNSYQEHTFLKEPNDSSDSSSSEERIIRVTTRATSTRAVTTPAATTPAAITPAATTPAAITPTATTPAATTPKMTTDEDRNTTTPEASTISTDQPIVMTTTLAPGSLTPSVNVTPTCDQCFTAVIPTGAPTTNNRGDN